MKQIKRYTVDLNLPPDKRWDNLLGDRWAVNAAKALTDANLESIEESIGWLASKIVKPLVACTYSLCGGTGDLDYDEDMVQWAEYAVGDTGLVRLGNLTYELYHFRPGEGVGLCTSVAFHRPRVGMVHARNMDWPLDAIRRKTILIDFECEAGPFTAVTCPGIVGVLSGVAKGRFSATINSNEMETISRRLNLSGWAATFLLRWVFENCKTYEEAVSAVKSARGVAPFFVQLVGVKKGQACVISVTPKGRNKVISFSGGPLGVSNHDPSDLSYRDTEFDDGTETDSLDRLDAIRNSARRCQSKTLRGCLAILRREPVGNDLTTQSMLFHPRTGKVLLNAL